MCIRVGIYKNAFLCYEYGEVLLTINPSNRYLNGGQSSHHAVLSLQGLCILDKRQHLKPRLA
jgi:hypothetical protein